MCGGWIIGGEEWQLRKIDEWFSFDLDNLKLIFDLNNWEIIVNVWECGKLLNLKIWYLISFSQLFYRNIDFIFSVVRFFEFKDVKFFDC